MTEIFNMRRPRLNHPAIIFAWILFCSLVALASKEFVVPQAHPARTYPAHDEHTMEKVTVAVDPYDVGYKASIFTVEFRKYGFMPVFLVVTNDGDQPITLAEMKAQLNTVNRSKLLPAGTEDLVRRMSRPRRSDTPNP